MSPGERVSYMHHSLPLLPIQVCDKFGVGTCGVCGGRWLQVGEEGEGGRREERRGARFSQLKNQHAHNTTRTRVSTEEGSNAENTGL